jgi:hypothetical protein
VKGRIRCMQGFTNFASTECRLRRTVPGQLMATRSAEDKITEPEGRDAGDEDFTVVYCLPADPTIVDGYSTINYSKTDLTDGYVTKL